MASVVRRVLLLPRHAATGAVKHSRFIIENDTIDFDRKVPIPAPAALAIVAFGDREFNVIHLDAEGRELTDTGHESLEEAIEQGRLEFLVQPEDWTVVYEPY